MKRKLQLYSQDVELLSLHLSSRLRAGDAILAAQEELARNALATHALLRDQKGKTHLITPAMGRLKRLLVARKIS
ncbi:hypothetical protein [Gallaecimonas sp. GXIMD1310]|uniref:hypothetical protein n=1 Tax=Gallaecimonas sp. GXIMD1310 TaxID=3131926 RepID=UPI003247DE99